MRSMASQEDCVALDISEHQHASVGELVTLFVLNWFL